MSHRHGISILGLIARYGGDARLEHIPWQHLPACLRETCQRFLQMWWDSMEIDQAIEASGLFNMTLAELLVYHGKQHEEAGGRARQYQLISFMRIEPEDGEPMTYEQALAEKEQQELLGPEHVHRIEDVSETSRP